MRWCPPRTQALLAPCWFLLALNASYAADYVGADACAACHTAEYQKQTSSHHFHALQRIEGSAIAEALLSAGHSPDNRLTYEASGDTIAISGDGLSEEPKLEWAFGAAAQGSTAVGHLGAQFFEHRFSYYRRIQGLAPTFGHAPRVSTPIAELGVLQDNRTIFRCFNCHGTGARLGEHGPDLTTFFPGVQCERCHGPGSAHIAAAKAGGVKEAVRDGVVNPGRLPPEGQIQFCGQCHRVATPEMGDMPELENPVTVRFAPIGLLASRCFRVSGKLSCLTCHSPHEDARPITDATYSDRCLSCHANTAKPVRFCRRLQKENCVPCHMKQASLGPYLRFTDHRIRVYR